MCGCCRLAGSGARLGSGARRSPARPWRRASPSPPPAWPNRPSARSARKTSPHAALADALGEQIVAEHGAGLGSGHVPRRRRLGPPRSGSVRPGIVHVEQRRPLRRASPARPGTGGRGDGRGRPRRGPTPRRTPRRCPSSRPRLNRPWYVRHPPARRPECSPFMASSGHRSAQAAPGQGGPSSAESARNSQARRERPVPLDRGRRAAQYDRRRFFDRQAGEIAELDHPRLVGRDFSQAFERIVEALEIEPIVHRGVECRRQVHLLEVRSAAFGRFLLARVVDQYPAHGFGRRAEEMAAAFPGAGSRTPWESACRPGSPRRRFQRVVGALVAQEPVSNVRGLAVDPSMNALEPSAIALVPRSRSAVMSAIAPVQSILAQLDASAAGLRDSRSPGSAFALDVVGDLGMSNTGRVGS